MTITETSLYDYHIKEWETFAKEQWDETEDGDLDDFTTELAESYWANFDDVEDTETTWKNVEYSAGVYLGEIDAMNITDRVILNDQTFYDEDGNEYEKELDMVQVTLMNSNPDLYGDECEEFIVKVLHELADQKMLQIMVDLNGKESLGGYITGEMMSRYPELVEVLCEWNQKQSFDQVCDFLTECNNGTIQAYMEKNGIDW